MTVFLVFLNINAEADVLTGNPSLHTIVSEMLEVGGDLREEARMLCLETMLRGNVPDFPKFVQQICFNHGIQQVPYLMRLCDCGMLDKALVKWSNFVKPFRLYNPDFDKNGDEAAMSYLGYAPLSIRYVESIVKKDFPSVQKVIGDSFETYQSGTPQENGTYIVFFVGGCTHSELNSLRRLAIKGPAKFSVCTTNMFSSREFFESIGFAIPGWKPIHL
ncbi:vesicle docking involved in exocytosis [Trichomonas vaginalis G3]|uniref:vesicle docking involved in exocytosis n=1 Tax=Trichomonas vaginalis (strain ATCC PRA-98 / G3) TaxID=412133 RepID=UPI0021569BCC|nr:vesicle docking involved in exocytosis [Trichomonas vaginalis G3]KAI5482684.1 vesicle docking involved in exocytosis [Trichomonas vaginalis G3]